MALNYRMLSHYYIQENPVVKRNAFGSDLRLANEVPFDQQAYVRGIIRRMMLCLDPEGGYARWICPSCQYELRVPFSCKTRFCPSCGKVKVDA